MLGERMPLSTLLVVRCHFHERNLSDKSGLAVIVFCQMGSGNSDILRMAVKQLSWKLLAPGRSANQGAKLQNEIFIFLQNPQRYHAPCCVNASSSLDINLARPTASHSLYAKGGAYVQLNAQRTMVAIRTACCRFYKSQNLFCMLPTILSTN
jgi:hypothetical protein